MSEIILFQKDTLAWIDHTLTVTTLSRVTRVDLVIYFPRIHSIVVKMEWRPLFIARYMSRDK